MQELINKYQIAIYKYWKTSNKIYSKKLKWNKSKLKEINKSMFELSQNLDIYNIINIMQIATKEEIEMFL